MYTKTAAVLKTAQITAVVGKIFFGENEKHCASRQPAINELTTAAGTERFFQPIVTEMIPVTEDSSPDRIPTHGIVMGKALLGAASSAPAISETIYNAAIITALHINSATVINTHIIRHFALRIYLCFIG